MILIKLRDSNAFYHNFGDIILTKSVGKLSKINTTAQTVRTLTKTNYTHAILCLNRGVFAEAMYGYDLRTFYYTDTKRQSLDSEEFKVIRYKHLKREQHYELFIKSVYFHLGKGYSLLNGPKGTFCSSFIALVYNSVFPHLFKNPNNVYPVTFERLLLDDKDNWKDVTEEYTQDIDSSIQNENIWLIDNTAVMNRTIEHTKLVVSRLEHLDKFNEFVEKLFPLEVSIARAALKNDKKKKENKPLTWKMDNYLKKKKKRNKK